MFTDTRTVAVMKRFPHQMTTKTRTSNAAWCGDVDSVTAAGWSVGCEGVD